ncbi:MAG: hypothetical protein J6S67_00395 [Methanobrevibacter sp.]|nr:hypothetical protein [Methanobrevibacter sp.]
MAQTIQEKCIINLCTENALKVKDVGEETKQVKQSGLYWTILKEGDTT